MHGKQSFLHVLRWFAYRFIQVHDGFLQAWNSIANETIASVQAELSNDPNLKINVIGHSLGGSLAVLATMSLLSSGLHNITTYTFGQPRTGNQAFADFVDMKAPVGVMFRVTHSNDGVPQVETTEKGFRHHSTEYWQEDKPIAAEIYRCTGQEPQVRGPPHQNQDGWHIMAHLGLQQLSSRYGHWCRRGGNQCCPCKLLGNIDW